MDSNYVKIYTGNFIIVQLITSKLNDAGVSPIIKDETESGRLAGFGPTVIGSQDIYVRQDEVEIALSIIEQINLNASA